MDSAEPEITCPTTPGLSTGGFKPGLDWSYVKSNPTQNWHVVGWLVCLAMIFVTWIVTLTVVIKHLRNYYEPQIQRHKLRVLLFPPVYATLAWFAYLRFDYSTTIMFFAVVFEAFAVFNLFTTLQAYLEPFRIEAGDVKEPVDTKIMFIFKCHLPSKWGMHYRIITDILVFQYPIWTLLDSFMSIFAELKGRYCEGVYSFKGAYVYLTIINFTSLSIILTALFTYLDVFHREWLRGKVKAHGMFWCVKGPIMFNFYFGEILLSGLATAGVIKGTDGTNGSIAWSVEAVKNGIYIIIICSVMMVDSFMMLRFFGPGDNIQNAANTGQTKKMTAWKAFVDGYLAYIPEFLHNCLCCGVDSYKLMKKRKELRKKKKLEAVNSNNPTDHLLSEEGDKNNNSSYRMNELGEHTSV
ncbi:organic solute transporter Ostalpha-domain-containing protein [Helicostylum pulchrum]|nr:organic solute transporter Ostalpha-domain-containing protein [Helicostylum pulchrum]